MNILAGQDIQMPESHRKLVETYVQRRDSAGSKPSSHPFNRNIDIWFFAIMVAVRKNLQRSENPPKSYKAAEGVVLNSDPWRVTSLLLLALSETKNETVLDRPTEIAKIANGYAAAGMEQLDVWLQDRPPKETVLEYLCTKIEDLSDD